MSGDANAGGGGSVYWTVDVDKGDNDPTKTNCENRGNGRYHQRGRDLDGVPNNDNFTITLRVPQTFNSASDYLNHLRTVGTITQAGDPGHVQFTLPIEDPPSGDKVQINIHWGGQVSDTGRNKKASAALLAKAPGAVVKKRSAKKASAKKPVAKKGKAKARGAKRR